MPRKTFVAGEVLAAADVNEFLSDQVVMTFAGTAARGSAIASPVEGMVTYLEDDDQLEVYGGTAVGWSSASNFIFGTAVPTDGQVASYSTAVSGWVPADASTGATGRNLLYNGAMQVAQRGTSATGLTGSVGYRTADRYDTVLVTLGTWTQTVEADGPTGSGFTKSLKYECTTANSSPAASDQMRVEQRLEGQDLQGLKKGTSAAESLTLSFWVKSNVTGTYIAELNDNDNSRSISAAYTVSSSGTWEKKTITFAGDTTGAFDNDNAASLVVRFWLGAGSNFTSGTLQTSWGANVTANRAVGQTNLAASTSNYWQVTGVQLEAGTVATAFEHKAYGVELAECQRYYYRTEPGAVSKILGNGFNLTTTTMTGIVPFPVTMRATPTALEQSGTANQYMVIHGNVVATTCSAIPTYSAKTSNSIGGFNFTVASGLTAGQGSEGRADGTNGANAYLAWSAEL